MTEPQKSTNPQRLFFDEHQWTTIEAAIPTPTAMLSKSYNGRSSTVMSAFIQQHGDPTGTKSSVLYTFIPEALATGKMDLRSECYVHEITVDEQGKAKSAVYQDADGDFVEQEADVFMLACGASDCCGLTVLKGSEVRLHRKRCDVRHAQGSNEDATTDICWYRSKISSTESRIARIAHFDWRQYVVYIGFVVLLLFFSIVLSGSGFLNPNNLLNIIRQTAIISVMAVAVTFVIAAAEIDLSIGALAGLASVVTALAVALARKSAS